MANTSAAILLALMVVATASMAHGLGLGVAIQVNITGDVKCSVAGKPDPVGLAGVNVSVMFNGTILALGITDSQGLITLSVKLTDSTDVPTVTANIALWVVKAVIPPQNTCAVTPPTGIVEAKLDVKSVVATPGDSVVIDADVNIKI